jgi:hypothetical protein
MSVRDSTLKPVAGIALLVGLFAVVPAPASGASGWGVSAPFHLDTRADAGTKGPDGVPSVTTFDGISPNPSNGRQAFELSIAPDEGPCELRVYGVTGQLLLRTGLRDLGVGKQSIQWDGCGLDRKLLPSGVYSATLATERGVVTRKVVRLR